MGTLDLQGVKRRRPKIRSREERGGARRRDPNLGELHEVLRKPLSRPLAVFAESPAGSLLGNELYGMPLGLRQQKPLPPSLHLQEASRPTNGKRPASRLPL